MGTVGYMSPEQVRGESADHRTDIFSFGVVLYEMLSGRKAFEGKSAVETLNAILHEEPAALVVTKGPMPPAMERLVLHCLEKAPENRFQSMKDLAFDLQAISTISSRRRREAEGPRRRRDRADVGSRSAPPSSSPPPSRRLAVGRRSPGTPPAAVLPAGLVPAGPDRKGPIRPRRAGRDLRRELAGGAVAALLDARRRPQGAAARPGRRPAHGPVARGRTGPAAEGQGRRHVAVRGDAGALGSGSGPRAQGSPRRRPAVRLRTEGRVRARTSGRRPRRSWSTRRGRSGWNPRDGSAT